MAKEKGVGFEEFSAKIKVKDFVPLYCFCGEEEYFIDALTDLIETHALNEMEKAFNMTIVYGKDSNARQIVEAVCVAADGLGYSPLEVALSWVRDAPGVTTTLVGARTGAQLRGILTVEQIVLPQQVRLALDEISENI